MNAESAPVPHTPQTPPLIGVGSDMRRKQSANDLSTYILVNFLFSGAMFLLFAV